MTIRLGFLLQQNYDYDATDLNVSFLFRGFLYVYMFSIQKIPSK